MLVRQITLSFPTPQKGARQQYWKAGNNKEHQDKTKSSRAEIPLLPLTLGEFPLDSMKDITSGHTDILEDFLPPWEVPVVLFLWLIKDPSSLSAVLSEWDRGGTKPRSTDPLSPSLLPQSSEILVKGPFHKKGIDEECRKSRQSWHFKDITVGSSGLFLKVWLRPIRIAFEIEKYTVKLWREL